MPAAKVDRRVSRTRQALRNALLALMAEVGWDEIDVASICDHADIGRSTFYLHFDNKGALLTASLDDLGMRLGRSCGAQQLQVQATRQLAFVDPLLEHVFEQQAVFRAIVGRRSSHVVQERFRELIVRLVSQELGLNRRSAWQQHATAHFLGGALLDLMRWWLEVRRPQRPEEIGRVFHTLTESALSAQQRGD